jgi:hypothetical protein
MFRLMFTAIIKPIPRVCEERNNSTAILVRNLRPYNGLYKVRHPGFGFFYHDSIAAVGLGLLVIEILRSNSDTPHLEYSSAQMIDPSQRPVPNNTQHLQRTSMYLAGFEPAILTSKRPQTRALGHQYRPGFGLCRYLRVPCRLHKLRSHSGPWYSFDILVKQNALVSSWNAQLYQSWPT